MLLNKELHFEKMFNFEKKKKQFRVIFYKITKGIFSIFQEIFKMNEF